MTWIFAAAFPYAIPDFYGCADGEAVAAARLRDAADFATFCNNEKTPRSRGFRESG
jgi:hypothetical protein